MSIARRLAAEAVGSMLLTAAVIGSGVMAERLAGGNLAIALLANTGATVTALAVLIALFAPVSGAHFNPAVSLVQGLRGALRWHEVSGYVLVQIAGCCAGTLLAHTMFELPPLQLSGHARSGPAQWLAEALATCGLLLVILGARRAQDAAWMVAGWIGAAYWFTASTSFANPAITVARALSDTFAGIRPQDAPFFMAAQIFGALIGLLLAKCILIPVARESTATLTETAPPGEGKCASPLRQS